MKISIILAHPNPESLNHAIAHAAAASLRAAGHAVAFHDLYAERFDPLLPPAELGRNAPLPADVAAHCQEIGAADGIIIVHPNWWGTPPAMLKGWIDRVLRMGVAYRFVANEQGEGVPQGLLRAKTALVLTTSNTPEERERAVFGDPLELFWKKCVFALCGVAEVHRRNFAVIITSTPAQRAAWLAEVAALVARSFPRSV